MKDAPFGFDVDVVVDATKPQMDQALRRFVNNLAGSIAAVQTFFNLLHKL